MLRGPQRVPVDQAIAWGRDHAGIVWVRAGDSRHYFSAGKHVPPGDEVVPWPQDGMSLSRRRDPAMRYLDRTPVDPPIRWAVTLRPGLAGAPPGFAERSCAHVIRTTAAVDRGNGGVGEVVFELKGTTHEEVEQAARAIAREAMRAAGAAQHGDRPAFGWTMSVQIEPASESTTHLDGDPISA